MNDKCHLFCIKRVLLQTCCCNPLVDARNDTEEGDTCGTDAEGNLGTFVALEGRKRTVGLSDVHSLNDEQIVVE